jgi:K+-transporting ATPase ATPase C chain
MRKELFPSIAAIVVFTLMLGIAYPLATTGVAQVLFPNKADGSQIERDGKVVGSGLIGQDFSKPVLDANGEPKEDADGNPVLEADPTYFQSRPSATGYSANVTYFNNLGPNSKDLRDMFKENLAAYLERERLDRVLELVDDNTDDRALGVLGEPGVNVLKLNLALDEEDSQ